MSEFYSEAGDTQNGAALDPRRLEAFSDGVMAVIITIMAFDLKTPVTASVHGLVVRVPSLLVYVLSFTVIGIYWNNHHHLLRATERINTEWVGTAHDRTLPAATYGAIALGAALAYYALVRAILRANPDDADIAAAVGKDIKGMVSPIVYMAGFGLAFVSPYLAYGCYGAVSLLWFIPDRRLTKST